MMGFEIFHKHPAYKPKNLYFKDLLVRKKWLDLLIEFQKGNVTDYYHLIQKIGSGSYSIVYKGV